ncbi:apolipoprotein L6-like [Tiliqua scincoides]|uniref:apolipoprotein L6-like n=1 Tax=Tiliqua scincoides TaxID=71010 RepID=UPI003462FE6A
MAARVSYKERVGNLGASEPLPDNRDLKQQQSLPEEDGEYMETLMTEFEREEFAREIFLKEFPAQRKRIKRCIRSLQKMADAIDETHKNCTKASIAANSTGAASGILTILGLTLTPFTAGGSLILTAGGLGLGAVATAAGVSASIYESASTSKETKKAQELINECEKSLQLPPDDDALEENDTNPIPPAVSSIAKIFGAVKGTKTNVQALKVAKANPALKALAKRATAGGSASQLTVRGAKHIKKAFGGTPLAMTKGVRLLGAAAVGVSLLYDAYNIVQDVQHLTEGAKAETATEIRKKVRKLKEKLQELNKLYKELKDKQSMQ